MSTPGAARRGKVSRWPKVSAATCWLGCASIVVSTANQENFGIAVAEAVAAGAFPLLPSRLSYPDLLPGRWHRACLYRTQTELVARLDALLRVPERLAVGRTGRSLAMRRYDWTRVGPALDAVIEKVVAVARKR